MRCALCKEEMSYIHGHAACVRNGCPMYGVNQAECCSGETAACGPLAAEVASAHDPRGGQAGRDRARLTAARTLEAKQRRRLERE